MTTSSSPVADKGRRPGAEILGGEPVILVSVLEAVVAVVLSFDAFSLSPEQSSVIMAVVVAAGGFYQAMATNDQLLASGIALVKALIALAAGFELSLTTNQTTAIIALATVLLGLFHRTQTSPSEGLSLRDDTKLAAPAVR